MEGMEQKHKSEAYIAGPFEKWPSKPTLEVEEGASMPTSISKPREQQGGRSGWIRERETAGEIRLVNHLW